MFYPAFLFIHDESKPEGSTMGPGFLPFSFDFVHDPVGQQ
jgi:hypothetical protein